MFALDYSLLHRFEIFSAPGTIAHGSIRLPPPRSLASSPVIRANRSVHKWYAKFRPGKFCPGIAFTVCTNQFHFPKNDREGLNPVSKMALKKWNTEKQAYLFRCFVAPGNFPIERPKKSYSIYFPTGFSGNYRRSLLSPLISLLPLRAHWRMRSLVAWLLHTRLCILLSCLPYQW